jgi:hypothetical protein
MAGIEDLKKRTAMIPTMNTGLQSLENQIYAQNLHLQNKVTPDNSGLSNQQVRSIINFGEGRGSEGDLLRNIFNKDIFNIKNNLKERYALELPDRLQNLINQYDLTKEQDFKEIGRMLVTGQAGYYLDLPDTVVKELMKDGGLEETTKNILINTLNNSPLPFNIQQTGKDKYTLFKYNKDNENSNFNLTSELDRGRVGANLNFNPPEIPIANNTNFRMGANIDERGRATGDLGIRYQPNKDTFFNAGVVYGEGKPKIGINFKHNFAQGGAVTDIDIFS